MPKPRTACEIIDQAIRENRAGEVITYGFAVVFVIVGVAALTMGIIRGQTVNVIAGVVTNSLCLPPMLLAHRTRRQNIAMRLLEQPLSKASTADDAAAMLQHVFSDVFTVDDRREQVPLVPVHDSQAST